jgi:hypothetical protein
MFVLVTFHIMTRRALVFLLGSMVFLGPMGRAGAQQTNLAATPSGAVSPLTHEWFIDPLKEAEILKMFKLNGTEERFNLTKEAMIVAMKQRRKDVPPQIWDRVEKDLDVQKLVDKEIALYDKYYTLDDLKAMNAFYESPAGQHMLSVTPQMRAESMRAGREWGQAASVKVMLELQDASLIMPSAAPATNAAANPSPPAVSAPVKPPATNAPPAALPPVE